MPVRVREHDPLHLDGRDAHRVTHPSVAIVAAIVMATAATNHWSLAGAGAAISGIVPLYPRDSIAR